MVVNPDYMDPKNLLDISKLYNKNDPKNIMLNSILQDKVFNLLSNKVSNSIFSSKFDPCKYRYSIASCKELDSFFYGVYFDSLVKNILSIKKYNIIYGLRKFQSSDFTLLHDSGSSDVDGIDFIMDLSKTSDRNGGYINYVNPKGKLLHIVTKPNSLSFVKRDKGSLYYVKYINHKQFDPIILIFGTIVKS